MHASADDLALAASRLIGANRLVEAEHAAGAGLKGHPRHARLHYERALALLKQGRVTDATDGLRAALARLAGDVNLEMLLAFTLNYDPRASAKEVAAAHLRYGMLLRASVGAAARIRSRGDGSQRAEGVSARRESGLASPSVIRVGLVSADLYRHSVAYFLEPLLEAMPRDRFAIIALSSSRAGDDVSARLRGLCHEWHDLAGVDHEAFARLARERLLDIAIDLSGLSAGHRQAALARRIAPVQVSYLGYPHAPGTDTIDARLGDAITDPPAAPNVMGERISRLRTPFVCYRAPELPPIEASPHRQATFGCFGNMAKINDAVLAAWSRVLAEVPGSRLLLKNPSLADPLLRAAIPARLAAAGIDPGRVELRPATPNEREHLAAYNEIDVSLDTFPYNGVTTTCEALAMGVPVVTFAGSSHAGRTGMSLLSAVEPGWCGVDAAAYIQKGVDLACVRPASEREGLRERFLASAICDARGLAESLGDALAGLAGV